jgi:NTE family protein
MNANPTKKKHKGFDRVALLLQGGGALGSYQAGVYEALAEAGIEPDWVAGISIGAINSALIAGSAPEDRVAHLREFWEAVSEPPLGPMGITYDPSFMDIQNEDVHRMVNRARAFGIAMFGAPDFFKPRHPLSYFFPSETPDKLSMYDVAPLRHTLERLVDFERINKGPMRFSVGATNVRTGNFVYFDNTTHHITASHVIASGSLPPGFPATEIDGEYYWDGGIVSNTPLEWLLSSRPRADTLAFQVDLWNAHGALPKTFPDIQVREKEIRFSSKTRAGTDHYKYSQKLRVALSNLLAELPPELRNHPDANLLAAEADDRVCTIVQLIYESKNYEGNSKDFEFSRRTMVEHWSAGYTDTINTLEHPEALTAPDRHVGVRTFDLAHDGLGEHQAQPDGRTSVILKGKS